VAASRCLAVAAQLRATAAPGLRRHAPVVRPAAPPATGVAVMVTVRIRASPARSPSVTRQGCCVRSRLRCRLWAGF